MAKIHYIYLTKLCQKIKIKLVAKTHYIYLTKLCDTNIAFSFIGRVVAKVCVKW